MTVRFAVRILSTALIALIALDACNLPQPKPAAPPYQPKFTYAMPAKPADKIDVTVGIVAPAWSGDGKSYWDANKDGEMPKALVSALKASFNELLSAKGFNTAGPFPSVDDMTFPEKKGVDFVLYPEVDVAISMKSSNQQVDTGGSGTLVCTLTIGASGNVQLLVKEPLSGEKIWVKRIDVSVPKQEVQATGRELCSVGMPPTGDAAPDEWAKAHVEVYQQIMTNLDKYVNGEEFQTLKKQAAELRAKKVY